jgi:integrase
MTMENDESKNKYERVGEIVSIFLRGRRWWANYQLKGKQERQPLNTTSKKEARRKALILEGKILEGLHQRQTKPVSIGAAIDAYLTDVRIRKRADKTASKYSTVLRRVEDLARRLKRKDLGEIDLSFLDVYRQERVERDGADPDSTITDELVIIRQLINFALRRKQMNRDPLEGLKIPKRRRKPQPCWRQPEVEQILQAAPEPYCPIFTILADTGFRVGEVQFLTWEDVDFENNLLHVRAKDDWKPKDGDQRSVPMSARLRALLEQLPRRSRWVVTAPATPKYPKGDHKNLDRRSLRTLHRVLKRLGLKGKIHTFRHAFLSQALIRGTPEALVRAWAGHVDWNILKLYTHIANTDSQAAMRRLSKAEDQPPVEGE